MFNSTHRAKTATVTGRTTEPTQAFVRESEAAPQLVDILIDVSDRADACVITVGGRIIVEQLEHDQQPALGQGVSLVKGGFWATSGPGRCPSIGRNNAVLLVHGVDRAVARAAGYAGDGVFKPTMTNFWVTTAERRHAVAGLI